MEQLQAEIHRLEQDVTNCKLECVNYGCGGHSMQCSCGNFHGVKIEDVERQMDRIKEIRLVNLRLLLEELQPVHRQIQSLEHAVDHPFYCCGHCNPSDTLYCICGNIARQENDMECRKEHLDALKKQLEDRLSNILNVV